MYWPQTQQHPETDRFSSINAGKTTRRSLNPVILPLEQSIYGPVDLSANVASIASNADISELISKITNELVKTVTSEGPPRDRNTFGTKMHSGSDVWGASTAGSSLHRISILSALDDSSQPEPSGAWRSPRVAQHKSSASVSVSPRKTWDSSPRNDMSELEPLPQVLHELDKEADDCIAVVRRITKLGFKSNKIIKSALWDAGLNVKKVIPLPSRAKAEGASPTGRPRPSSMGFVVFTNPQHARIFLRDEKRMIDGVEILIQPFDRQYKPTVPQGGRSIRSST